ncbi:T9SS type A sorting domain-containing protein [Hymenobacter sp. HD11105]
MPLSLAPRRVLLLLLLLLLTPWPGVGQAPRKQWDRTLGSDDLDSPRAVLPTPDGGSLVGGSSWVGSSGDKTQAGYGTHDGWLVKLNAQGQPQWDKTYGGQGSEGIDVIRALPDGGYLLGGSSSSGPSGTRTQPNRGSLDFWLVKVDAQGQQQWDHAYGGSGEEQLWEVLLTPDGGYILGGSSKSPVSGEKSQASQGDWDYWLVKVDAQGQKQWDRTYGGAQLDFATALTLTADGGYLLGGYSASGSSGDKTEASRGFHDYWVVKLDAQGRKQWDRTLGGAGYEELRALHSLRDGGYLLAGSSQGGATGDRTETKGGSSDKDFWLVNLDATGTKRWDHAYGSTDDQVLTACQPTPDGGFLLGGTRSGFGDVSADITEASRGAVDFWLLQVDAQGRKVWDKTLGSKHDDRMQALQLTPDGGAIVVGSSSGPISGEKSETPRGKGFDTGFGLEYLSDYWIVKLGPALVTATRAAAESEPLQVWPNPTRGGVTLQLPAAAPRTGLLLQVLDATGRLVVAQPLVVGASGKVTVELGAQPPGLYYLRVQGSQGEALGQRVVLH